jgi:hypothetical protein
MPGVKEDFSAIPHELQNRAQWLIWKKRQRGEKVTKVPFQSSNPRRNASVTDASTWGSFEAAVGRFDGGLCDGIGFVLTDDDPYCFVDFDNIIDNGKMDVRARRVIRKLNSYTERSPSGSGAHVIILGSLGQEDEYKRVPHKTEFSPYGGGLEIYDRERYFCFTGHRIRGFSESINRSDTKPIVAAIRKGNGGRRDLEYGADRIPGESQERRLGEPSRHDKLRIEAHKLVTSGKSRAYVEDLLWAMAREIGLPDRERDEVGRIIEWAFKDSEESPYERRVQDEHTRLHVRREASARFNTDLAGGIQSTDSQEATEYLASAEDELFIVNELMSVGSNTLLSAEQKTGKTTFVLNLVKCLLDEEPFLTQFDVSVPDGRIMFLNYEMPHNVFSAYLERVGLKNQEALLIKDLRGKAFPFWESTVRDALVEECHEEEVWCIVFDTMVRAAWGLVDNENDNTQWMGFQAEVDLLKELAGVSNSIMVHHTGKSSPDRARGATRIEDGNDDLWYLERGQFEFDTAREFSARGRWTERSPISLKFDTDSGLYLWDGSTAVESRSDLARVALLQDIVASHAATGEWPALSLVRGRMRKDVGCGGNNTAKTSYLDGLAAQGVIARKPAGNTKGDAIVVLEAGLGLLGA